MRKCIYCEKNKVAWSCLECSFGVCNDCIEEEYLGKCMGECFDKLPDLVDQDLIDEAERSSMN